MKLLLLSLFFLFYSQLTLAELVRVRLSQAQDKIVLSGRGLIVQGQSRSVVEVAIPREQHVIISRESHHGQSVWIVQGISPQAQIISDPYLLIQGDQLTMGAHSLPKKILFSHTKKNQIDVVGVMSLDDYLVGVLASEMPLNWPLETLKAQAVAARSYALSIMRTRKTKPYQLESTILDQVYRHVVAGNDQDPLIEKAVKAVQETQNVVLLQKNGRVLKAFYHADCGGKTTKPQSVWSFGYNSGVTVDSWCPANPKTNWNYFLSKEKIKERLSKVFHFSDEILLQGLRLLRPSSGDRVTAVVASLSDGRDIKIEANEFRQLIGYQYLKSTMFELNLKTQGIEFSGRGFGHGVGMCQWGSRYLGQNGYDYLRILNHYYPLAVISRR